MRLEELTVAEKLLMASLELRKVDRTFTAEDLVVKAWQMFPDAFGLAGYADLYPDSNRILTNIMGTKGMRGKGWLRKVGEKQYNVTGKAISDGELLISRTEKSSESDRTTADLRAALDRGAAGWLSRVMSTLAARKALGRQIGDVSFTDACGFWDITARSNANTLQTRLAETEMLLKRIMTALQADKNGASIRVDGDSVNAQDIERLQQLHIDMQVTFRNELDVIRLRTDERLEKKRRLFQQRVKA